MSSPPASASAPKHMLILGGTGRVGQRLTEDALARGYRVTALVRNARNDDNQTTTTRPNYAQLSGSVTSSSDILRALISVASSYTSTSTSTPAGANDAGTGTGTDDGKVNVTIISTLGQTRTNPSNPWSATTSPPLYMSHAAQAVVDALRTLLLLSSSSSLAPASISSSSSNNNPTVNINTTITRAAAKIRVEKYIVLSMFGTGNSLANMNWSLRWVMAHSNMRQTMEDHDAVIRVIRENFVGSTAAPATATTSTSTTATTKGTEGENRKLNIPFVVVRPVMLKFDGEGDVPVPAIREHGNGNKGMGVLLKCDVRSLCGFMLGRVEDASFDGQMPVVSN